MKTRLIFQIFLLLAVLSIACGKTNFNSSAKVPAANASSDALGGAGGDDNGLGREREEDSSKAPETFKIGETQTSGAIDILLLLDTSYSMTNNIAKVKAGIPTLWESLPDADLRLGVRTISTTPFQSRKNINKTTEKEFEVLISSDDFTKTGYKYNTLNFNDVTIGNEFFTANAIVNPKNDPEMAKVNEAIEMYIKNSSKNTAVVNENSLCAALLGYQSVDAIKGVTKDASLFRSKANAFVAIVVSDEDAQALAVCDSDVKMSTSSGTNSSYICSKTVSQQVVTCLDPEEVEGTCGGGCKTYNQVSYDCSTPVDGGGVIPKTCTKNGTCSEYYPTTSCMKKTGKCLDTTTNYKTVQKAVSASFPSLDKVVGYTPDQCRLVAGTDGVNSFTYRKTNGLDPNKAEELNVKAYKDAVDKFKGSFTPARNFILSAISYTGEDSCISNDKDKAKAENYQNMADQTKGVVACIEDEDYGSVMKKISVGINEVVLTYSVHDASKITSVSVDGVPLESGKGFALDLEKNKITLDAKVVKVGQTVQIFYD